MRREGRQHGMVKTHCTFASADIIFPKKTPSKVNADANGNGASTPPTAGVFTRVPSKPTNHSKLTGKCRHHPPCSKSKDKAKGSSKHTYELGCGELSLSLDGYSSAMALDELHHYTRVQNHGGEDEEDED